MPEDRLLTDRPAPSRRRASIFRLAPPRVTADSVLKAARRLGLEGDLRSGSLQQDARQMAYVERSFEVVLYHASGGLRFHDTARWQVDDGRAHVAFDDAEAIRMAVRYIEQFDVVALSECKVLRVTRLNVGVAQLRTGVAERRIIDAGVAFQRMVEDVPVEGAGGKVMVYIDHEGQLTGVDRLWREIEGVDQPDVELRSPEAAQREVVRAWGEPGSGRVVIEDVRFGYYEATWDGAQRYLQPAYIFPMTIVVTEGPQAGEPLMRSEHVVPAAVESPEPLMPAPVDRPPRSARQPEERKR